MTRRLDALFAERVLGLQVSHVVINEPRVVIVEECPDCEHGCESHTVGTKPLPSFTTSLDAAWEGAAKVGWAEISGPFSESEKKYLAYVSNDGPQGFTCEADHPAHALVLACLRAVGVSEEEIEEASK